MIEAVSIGNNIRAVRKEKGLTQEALAKASTLKTTQLSSYETGKQMPGLVSLANIAKSLNVSIDRLYFGRPSEAIANQSSDFGETVVNCVLKLVELGVVNTVRCNGEESPYGYLSLIECACQLSELHASMRDFENRKDYFEDPEVYQQSLKRATINEINKIHECKNNPF